MLMVPMLGLLTCVKVVTDLCSRTYRTLYSYLPEVVPTRLHLESFTTFSLSHFAIGTALDFNIYIKSSIQ